jgi:hypothetical protein
MVYYTLPLFSGFLGYLFLDESSAMTMPFVLNFLAQNPWG